MPLYDYFCQTCGCEFERFSERQERVECGLCENGGSVIKRFPKPAKLTGTRAADYKKSEAKKKRVNDIVKKQTGDKSL